MTKNTWVLRIGLGITFILVGIMILQDPRAWGSYADQWVLKYLFAPIETVMIVNGILDIVIGLLLLLGRSTSLWLGGLLGAAHLATVLVVSGSDDMVITVRDIGLFSACLYIALEAWPTKFKFW